eukprot:CAMPEP_0117005758 /NCGR_PEP_ID=MMETSP0472-20121206/6240_1 /TAXON_ID=693140 ORGANISM="Tiarina fusus, Strain LIS" /NCGR_SAMPLE_ID=MMETSP0472 /ASSEMBLY_ACC=CAM_ASM_000603 /LENGTH=597 /DNA_ID=CAMNT_0004707051 /DNA_START=25 /DNA_END=1815 /DNA_ORIENTATION=+
MASKGGEMSEDMADFIKRKRQSESQSSDGMDEKQRKREEIMKRVAERRKQREQEGAGTAAASAGASKLNEELKRKDAEHQKEVFEMRKTIDELRKQLTELQASSRKAENLQKELDENKANISTIEEKLKQSQKETEALTSKISQEKEQHENQLKQAHNERDILKTDKASLETVISGLKQQIENLNELQASGDSDEKITQLNEELSQKINENCMLQKMNELATFEKDQLKDMLEEQEELAAEQTKIIESTKTEYKEHIASLEEKNASLTAKNKELLAKLEEFTALNSELREALSYEKSVVESQEVKIRKLTEAPPSPAPVANAAPSSGNEAAPKEDNSASVRPSDSFEAALVGEINLLRKNPDSYADYLVDLIECYNGLQFKTRGSDHTFDTKEGVAALEDAIEYLQSCQHSCPPLVLKDGLCKSAQFLCDQNGPAGTCGSDCADGTSSSDRLVKFGQWKGRIMELMSYGPRANSPRDVVTQWLIDDGNSARSQRTTLLDFDFAVAGVGSGTHKEMSFMTVLALAKSYKDSSDTSVDDNEGDTKSNLKESADKNFFIITSEPCRVPKAQLSLKLDGKVLHLITNGNEDDTGKKSSHQW